ncbi:MAG: hypothetical protein GY832_30985 [Chloroflexi bacterium]|nr:hypothetical protein [Chloroflexota bacterium]
MANKATVDIGVTGTKNVLKAFDDIGKKGNSTFKGIAKEAAIMGAAVLAAYGLVSTAVKKATGAYATWQVEVAKMNRMLGQNEQQIGVTEKRLLALINGPLGTIPGALETVNQGLYDYLSAMGQADNMAYVWEDVEAAARYAAATGSDFAQSLANGAKIAATAGDTHGSLAKIFDMVAAGEQDAIGSAQELTDATMASVGSFIQLGDGAAEAIAVLAQLSKTGRNLQQSGFAMKTVIANFQTERALLESLGVEAEDFLGIMDELSEVDLSAAQLKTLFGARYMGNFALLLDRTDELRATYEKVRGEVGLIDSQYQVYAQTMQAKVSKAENEAQMRLINLGNRMEEVGLDIKVLEEELKVGFAELASWVGRNKELVLAAFLAIRAAILAFQGSNPFGWITLAVGAVVSLIASIDSTEQALLDAATASRKMAESQLASIQTAKDQIEVQRAEAIELGKSAEAVNELTESYKNLAAAELEAERNLIQANVLEQQAQAMYDIADIANELYAGAAMEKAGKEQVNNYLEQLDSIEKIQAVQQELNSERTRFIGLQGDTEKQADAIREAIEARYGVEVDSTLNAAELLTEYERLSSTIDGQIGTLQSKNLLEGNNLVLMRQQQAISNALVDADILTVEAMGRKLLLQKENNDAWWQQLVMQRAALELQGKFSGAVERAYNDAMERRAAYLTSMTASMGEVTAALSALSAAKDDSEGGGGGGGAGETREDELLKYEKRGKEDSLAYIDGWLEAMHEKDKELSAAVVGTNKAARTAAIDEAATEYETRMAKVSMALAGTFNGIFTDESFNLWDNFEKMGMKAFENLLAWAVANGIFSIFTGGVFGGIGSAGIIGDIFGFASGGYIPATPGGQIIRVAEGGEGEWVVNQEQMKSLMTGGLRAAQVAAQLNAPRPAANNETTVNNQTVVNGMVVGDLATLDSLNQRAAAQRNTY